MQVKTEKQLNQELDLKTQFAKNFKHQGDLDSIKLVKAPGRVNLIGEHTDYNGGFVLPLAINYYTWVAFTPRNDRELHIIANDFSNEKVIIELDDSMHKDTKQTWSNYISGVVQELQKKGFTLAGGNLFIAGNVPIGAGLSSSEQIDPTQAALAGQAAENNFVGCNCGIMDQLISALGKESSALLIDCENLSTRSVPIPSDWELLIVHSGVERGLVDSEYNQRRRQCESAAAHFGKKTLRGVSSDELTAHEHTLDLLTFKRARHVLTENARTLLAAEALAAGDMQTLIKVMAESHESMRDDFNITTPSIDTLVDILSAAGAGQAGVRMTGGGFGGCVVSIAPANIISQLVSAVRDNYQMQTGCIPTLIPAKAVAGAFS
ncbi:MAG: galactokinase [Moraxellaceae bacterium]|nr:MAG: galactokinase [Moraxellaceae bacterium]